MIDINLIKLDEVIRELLLESHDEDSYLHNTSETQIIFHTRNAFTNLLYVDGMNGFMNNLMIDLEYGWRLTLPEDYIKFVKLSGVDDTGGLHPLFVDNSINDSTFRLKNESGEYLLDSDNKLLLGRLTTGGSSSANTEALTGTGIFGRNYNLTTGVATINGQYKLSLQDRSFTITDSPFSSFVLQYISDPSTFTDAGVSQVTVKKEWKEAIKLKAYFEIISKRRKVPMNEKQNAERLSAKAIQKARLTSAPTFREYLQYFNRTNGGAIKI